MTKRAKTLLAGATTILAGSFLGGCTVFGIRTVEEPPYSIVVEDGDIEVRDYGDVLIARTVTDGEYDDGSNPGFRRLAGYIFGGNEKDESIAMTAPVMQEQGVGDWTHTFVLPPDMELAEVPDPLDDRVEISTMTARRVAAIRYSGYLTAESISEYSERLLAWVEANGYEVRSEPRSAGYDPPWTIPFLRRNEVLVDVGGSP